MVKYTGEELQFIRKLCAECYPPRKLASAVNVKFHRGRPVRTERSAEFAVAKLKITKRKFTRVCEVCGDPFETSWPQARYCKDECKAVTEREYAAKVYKRDPTANLQAQSLRVRERIEARWCIILEHFGDRCGRCKHQFQRVVYDLHHPAGKPSRKETPSKIIRAGTDEQFLKMLSETVLLCANCHRLTHAESGNWAPGRKDI